MTFLLPWLNKNTFAVLGIVALCVAIFTAGGTSERRKQDAAVAKLNVPLAEQRGKDEAEIAAEAERAKTVDERVRERLSKRFILDAETAALMRKVK